MRSDHNDQGKLEEIDRIRAETAKVMMAVNALPSPSSAPKETKETPAPTEPNEHMLRAQAAHEVLVRRRVGKPTAEPVSSPPVTLAAVKSEARAEPAATRASHPHLAELTSLQAKVAEIGIKCSICHASCKCM